MSRLFALILAVAIAAVGNVAIAPARALPGSYAPAILGLKNIFQGTPPSNLGLHDGHLTICPSSPNCVVSQDADAEHQIAPISYQGDRDAARETLLNVLSVVPQTEVVKQGDDYLRVEFSTRIMGFVDDGEFYFSPDEKVIHVRSASRLGESDLGVNRRRLEQIRLAMQDLGA